MLDRLGQPSPGSADQYSPRPSTPVYEPSSGATRAGSTLPLSSATNTADDRRTLSATRNSAITSTRVPGTAASMVNGTGSSKRTRPARNENSTATDPVRSGHVRGP